MSNVFISWVFPSLYGQLSPQCLEPLPRVVDIESCGVFGSGSGCMYLHQQGSVADIATGTW